MNWRFAMGSDGIGGEYKTPEGVEVQEQGVIMEIDLLHMSIYTSATITSHD
jgi:hypothetical protein